MCKISEAVGQARGGWQNRRMTSISIAPTPAPRPGPEPRDHYRVWCDIHTRWSDNDAYGHVNNVVYYSWFDTAVNQWLIAHGALDIHQGDTIGLVVETQCNYFAPLAFPEPVRVGLRVARIGGSSVRYELGVFGAGDLCAAKGHFIHVYVDRQTRRPVSLPDNFLSVLKALA